MMKYEAEMNWSVITNFAYKMGCIRQSKKRLKGHNIRKDEV